MKFDDSEDSDYLTNQFKKWNVDFQRRFLKKRSNLPKDYKQQELKHRLEAIKPSIHTKDGQVVPITPGSKKDSLTWNFKERQKYETKASKNNTVGSTPVESASKNADKAINTKYVGTHSTWSMGGKVFAPQEGSGYKVGDIPGKPSGGKQPTLEKEYQNTRNPNNSQYPDTGIRGEFRTSNQVWDEERQRMVTGTSSDPKRHLDAKTGKPISTGTSNKASLTQTTNTDKGKSAWSQMSNSQKAGAVANVAFALQKLDGSKDELIWKGTGWGGIGSGGHSGYVG